MRVRHLSALTALVFASSKSAAALGYDEHCRLSNRALQFAALRILQNPSRPEHHTTIAMRALRLSFGTCSPKNPDSYGDLVALADYGMSPVDFYLASRFDEAARWYDTDSIPWNAVRLLAADKRQNARAARMNDDHFQDRALFGAWFWHQMAVSRAAVGKFETALLINAFADHFAQDATAPGHIRTPRRGFHDLPSLAIHDWYNYAGGRHFTRNGVRLGSVAPWFSADSLTSFARALHLSANETRSMTNTMKWWSTLLEDIAVHDSTGLAKYLLQREQVAEDFFGDDRIDYSLDQEVFATLVAAHSLSDVLMSVLTGERRDSFDRPTWIGYTTAEQKIYGPLAQTTFGEFRDTPVEILTFVPIVGFSLGHASSLAAGADVSTVRASADVLALGWPGGDWMIKRGQNGKAKDFYLGIALGYEGGTGGELRQHGFRVSLIKPLRRVDTQFRLYAARREYRRKDAEPWRWAYGAGIETGVSVFYASLGLERDWRIDDANRTRGMLSIVSGLTIGLPCGRMPILQWLPVCP